MRSLIALATLFLFAATSDAGWLRDRIQQRRANGSGLFNRGPSCASGCQTATGSCGTNCASATDNGCAGCATAAAPNGTSFTTASTPQLVQVCVDGKCQLVPAESAVFSAPPSTPKQASVNTIVIDGKSYRLTPIASP